MRNSKKRQNKKSFLTFRSVISQARGTQFTLPHVKIIWLSLLLVLVTVSAVIFSQKSLPPQVPLYYGLAEGESQLSSSIGLMTPGIIALSITILNILVSLFIENQFLQKSLILASLAVCLFSLLTTVKIIFLVGSF